MDSTEMGTEFPSFTPSLTSHEEAGDGIIALKRLILYFSPSATGFLFSQCLFYYLSFLSRSLIVFYCVFSVIWPYGFTEVSSLGNLFPTSQRISLPACGLFEVILVDYLFCLSPSLLSFFQASHFKVSFSILVDVCQHPSPLPPAPAISLSFRDNSQSPSLFHLKL